MESERFYIRGRLDVMVLKLDDPLPVEKGRRVRVRFIPVPSEPGQTWDDIPPEVIEALKLRLATLDFAPQSDEPGY